jgi:preprotein translocase subunit Sss1
MAPFDPYHIWLEISPDEQPPTPHRLLGIAPDETDKEIIREAALQRNAFIRQFSLGEQGKIAERLLNEIAAARDNILAGNVQTAVETPSPVETPIEPDVEKVDPAAATPVSPIPVVVREPVIQEFPVSVVQPTKKPRREVPKEIWKRPAVIGISLVGVIGVLALLMSMMSSGDADPIVSNTAGRISSEMAVEKADAEKAATVTAAVAEGDWKTVLSLDPDNSEGKPMQAADNAAAAKAAADKAAADKSAADKSAAEKDAVIIAAVEAALGKGNWRGVLALDPKNKEGLRMQAANSYDMIATTLVQPGRTFCFQSVILFNSEAPTWVTREEVKTRAKRKSESKPS